MLDLPHWWKKEVNLEVILKQNNSNFIKTFAPSNTSVVKNSDPVYISYSFIWRYSSIGKYRFTESAKLHRLLSVWRRSPRNVTHVRSMKGFLSRSVKDVMGKRVKGNGKWSYGEPGDKETHQDADEASDGLLTNDGVCQKCSYLDLSGDLHVNHCLGQVHGPHRNLMGVTAKMSIGEIERSSCTHGEQQEQQNRDRTSLRNWGIRRFTANWGDLSQGFECNLDVKLKPTLPTEVKVPYGSFQYWHLCKHVLRFYYILIYLVLLDVVHPSLGINKSRKIKNCK